MILGCIDIGSNTTRLLVAEANGGPLRELAAEKSFTRLGRVAEESGQLPTAALERTAKVVAAQHQAAVAAGVQELSIVATAVIRHCPNRSELADLVRIATGLELQILTGEREAELSFAGATQAMETPPTGPLAVVDVGGGSTEIAVGRHGGGVQWCESRRIGSGLLADAYLDQDPPTAAALDVVRARVEEGLRGLDPPQVDAAFAVGGTATSLHRLVGPELAAAPLRAAVDTLARTPSVETAARLGLLAERVRLLPAGILLLAGVAQRLSCALRVADGGLREGVIGELYAARA